MLWAKIGMNDDISETLKSAAQKLVKDSKVNLKKGILGDFGRISYLFDIF